MLIYVEHRFSSSLPQKECFIQDRRLIISWLTAVSFAILPVAQIYIPGWLTCLFSGPADVCFYDCSVLLKSNCLPYFTSVPLNPGRRLVWPAVAHICISGRSRFHERGFLRKIRRWKELQWLIIERLILFFFHQRQISNNSSLFPQPNLVQTILLWDPPQAGWQGLGSRGGWGKWSSLPLSLCLAVYISLSHSFPADSEHMKIISTVLRKLSPFGRTICIFTRTLCLTVSECRLSWWQIHRSIWDRKVSFAVVLHSLPILEKYCNSRPLKTI